MGEMTLLIQRASAGEREAFDQAYAHIHAELKSLARRRLNADAGSTLSPTMLVNETWLKLVDRELHAENRAHFFRIAAQAMRQIWIDRLRSRGAEAERIRLYVARDDDGEAVAPDDWSELVDWDSAMRALQQADSELAELVDLRVFSGLDLADIAALKGVSERTVQRAWRSARAFLLNL